MFTIIAANVLNPAPRVKPLLRNILALAPGYGFFTSARSPSVSHNWGKSHTLSTFR